MKFSLFTLHKKAKRKCPRFVSLFFTHEKTKHQNNKETKSVQVLFVIMNSFMSCIFCLSDLSEVQLLEEIIEAVGDVGRQDRQIDEFGRGDFEKCALVGFEFRRGEECNEVKEIECYPVNVTKKR